MIRRGGIFFTPVLGAYLEFAFLATDQRKSARALVWLVDQPHGSRPVVHVDPAVQSATLPCGPIAVRSGGHPDLLG
jgi:hypothetical protein